jgi:hypothetical protein
MEWELPILVMEWELFTMAMESQGGNMYVFSILGTNITWQ